MSIHIYVICVHNTTNTSLMGCKQTTPKIIDKDIIQLRDKCQLMANDLIMIKETMKIVKSRLNIENCERTFTSSHNFLRDTNSTESTNTMV